MDRSPNTPTGAEQPTAEVRGPRRPTKKGLLIDGRRECLFPSITRSMDGWRSRRRRRRWLNDGRHKLGMLKFWEIRSKKSIMNIYNVGASKAIDWLLQWLVPERTVRLSFIGFIGHPCDHRSLTSVVVAVDVWQCPGQVPTLNSGRYTRDRPFLSSACAAAWASSAAESPAENWRPEAIVP